MIRASKLILFLHWQNALKHGDLCTERREELTTSLNIALDSSLSSNILQRRKNIRKCSSRKCSPVSFEEELLVSSTLSRLYQQDMGKWRDIPIDFFPNNADFIC